MPEWLSLTCRPPGFVASRRGSGLCRSIKRAGIGFFADSGSPDGPFTRGLSSGSMVFRLFPDGVGVGAGSVCSRPPSVFLWTTISSLTMLFSGASTVAGFESESSEAVFGRWVSSSLIAISVSISRYYEFSSVGSVSSTSIGHDFNGVLLVSRDASSDSVLSASCIILRQGWFPESFPTRRIISFRFGRIAGFFSESAYPTRSQSAP